MSRLPVFFVSHGAPTVLTDASPAHSFLASIPSLIGVRPRAILIVSAHFVTRVPTVTSDATLPTVYDFYGFPDELYAIRYPAVGDASLAAEVIRLLKKEGIAAEADDAAGLDHGAWVPLALAYPAGDIPVVALSITTDLDPARQLAIGRALASLRDDGVLIVGSGSATHNLGDINWGGDVQPAAWARGFDAWLAENVTAGDTSVLLAFEKNAPSAARAHPMSDHLMPLFTALGAADGDAGRRIHASFSFGNLSMAAFAWGDVCVR